MIRLLFLIRSLNTGGAERQLVELVKALDKQIFKITVATFYDGGNLRKDLEQIQDITLVSLGRKSRWDIFPFLSRLLILVMQERPHIIHGYTGVCNELGLIMARLFKAKAIFGIRASDMDLSQYDWAARVAYKLGAWFSRFSDLTIINSHSGKSYHTGNGYSERQMIVIPNGIDTERFQALPQNGLSLRQKWGIAKDEKLVGLVARIDPMKGHDIFLQAAALLVKQKPGIRFVCVGDGPLAYKKPLQVLADHLGLGEQIIWGGNHNNMSEVYSALDILVSSSTFGEGFSNVIGEAMACGLPCIVSDVGDSARIVSTLGKVIPPKDPAKLAEALNIVLEELDNIDRFLIREHILSKFNVSILVSTTTNALLALL